MHSLNSNLYVSVGGPGAESSLALVHSPEALWTRVLLDLDPLDQLVDLVVVYLFVGADSAFLHFFL